MSEGYCAKHEWSHGMGRRCPDCVELEGAQAERDRYRAALEEMLPVMERILNHTGLWTYEREIMNRAKASLAGKG